MTYVYDAMGELAAEYGAVTTGARSMLQRTSWGRRGW